MGIVLSTFCTEEGLFKRSEGEAKRQLQNLFFHHWRLNEKTLLLDIHEAFSALMEQKQCLDNWRWRESNSRPIETTYKELHA